MNLSGLCCAATAKASPNVLLRLKSVFPSSILLPYLLLIVGCKSLRAFFRAAAGYCEIAIYNIPALCPPPTGILLWWGFVGGLRKEGRCSWISSGPACGTRLINAAASSPHRAGVYGQGMSMGESLLDWIIEPTRINSVFIQDGFDSAERGPVMLFWFFPFPFPSLFLSIAFCPVNGLQSYKKPKVQLSSSETTFFCCLKYSSPLPLTRWCYLVTQSLLPT